MTASLSNHRDQSSECSGLDDPSGQRIGLCSTKRHHLALVLLASFFLTPAISFSQSPSAQQVSNEGSLFKALLAAKSESESKTLLQINRKLITQNLWERFKQERIAAY